MSELEKLIADLKSGQIAAKRQALSNLRSLGSNVVPVLVSVVESAEDRHIGWTLEGYDYERGEGQKNNFRQIEDTVKDDHWYVSAITHLLVEFRETFIGVLTPLLTHTRPAVRAWAAFVLGEIGDRRAVLYLLTRLEATDHAELWRVCEALGKLRAVEAVERLIELLEDEEAGVDGAAAMALGQIGDLRGLMPIIEQFKKHKPSVYSMSAALYHFGEHAVLPLTEVLFDSEASRVHDLALMKLGDLKDQRAIAPILRYLDSSQDPASKRAAITALGRLKAEQAVSLIAELFQTASDNDVRVSSAMALAKIGNRTAFETLVHELEHGTPERQHDVALAFGQMEALDEIEPLLTALKRGSPPVRRAIAVSLGNLRDNRAVPALREALNDPNEDIRRYAKVALDKISEVNKS